MVLNLLTRATQCAILMVPQMSIAAEFVQASNLLSLCEHGDAGADAYSSWCYGYLLAVVDGWSVNGMMMGNTKI